MNKVYSYCYCCPGLDLKEFVWKLLLPFSPKGCALPLVTLSSLSHSPCAHLPMFSLSHSLLQYPCSPCSTPHIIIHVFSVPHHFIIHVLSVPHPHFSTHVLSVALSTLLPMSSLSCSLLRYQIFLCSVSRSPLQYPCSLWPTSHFITKFNSVPSPTSLPNLTLSHPPFHSQI